MQTSTQLFGTPFFVSVPNNTTYQELYSLIKASVSRWLRPANEDDDHILSSLLSFHFFPPSVARGYAACLLMKMKTAISESCYLMAAVILFLPLKIPFMIYLLHEV